MMPTSVNASLQQSAQSGADGLASSAFGGGFSTGSFVVGGGSADTRQAQPLTTQSALFMALGIGAVIIAAAIYFRGRK